MNSFQSYAIDTAPAASKPTLEEAKRTFGFVPNLQAHMAESLDALRANFKAGKHPPITPRR